MLKDKKLGEKIKKIIYNKIINKNTIIIIKDLGSPVFSLVEPLFVFFIFVSLGNKDKYKNKYGGISQA
jgi:hypothetical protein